MLLSENCPVCSCHLLEYFFSFQAGSHYIAHADREVDILSLPSTYWDYTYVPP